MRIDLLMVLVAGTLLAVSATEVSADTALLAKRATFEQAWQYARDGKTADVDRLRPSLTGYPLNAYLDYALLEQQGADAAESAIKVFVVTNADLPVAKLLQSSWLSASARAGRSEVFERWPLPARSSQEVRCVYTDWLLKKGRDGEARKQLMGLWLTGSSVDEACDLAFKTGMQRGWIDTEAYDQRLELAAKSGNQGLTDYLAPKASAQAQEAYKTFIVDLSVDGLNDQLRGALAPHKTPWLEMGLSQRIRSDAKVAQPLVAQVLSSPYLDPLVRNRLGRDLAVFLAADHHTESLGVFAALPPAAFDHGAVEWHARGALVAGDWLLLKSVIERMPADLSADERWRYWLAESERQSKGAASGFEALSDESHFFGFLSADRLDQAYPLCQSKRPLQPELLAQVLVDPGIKRALELYHLGLLHFARLEWSKSLRANSPSWQIQAALLASQEGWHEKAISGLSSPMRRTLYRDRFPVVHADLFEAAAARYGLDPDVLIAIARAESALTKDAVSRAGAQGLMQLMPATASRLAKPNGISLGGSEPLFDPATNIELGSLHLAELVERFNHPVFALAAYNAGPEAVDRWWGRFQPDDPLIWLETIPYRETREYVARVLAFASIYRWRRTGDAGSISSWLPPFSRANGFPVGDAVAVRCP